MEEVKKIEEKTKPTTMYLYAIYDKKAKKFGSFMFSDNKENAIRQYLQMIANTPFYSEYSLYEILSVNPFTEVKSDSFGVYAINLVEYSSCYEIKDITPSEDVIDAYRGQVIKFEQLLNKR